jgi:hypothetical protein
MTCPSCGRNLVLSPITNGRGAVKSTFVYASHVNVPDYRLVK